VKREAGDFPIREHRRQDAGGVVESCFAEALVARVTGEHGAEWLRHPTAEIKRCSGASTPKILRVRVTGLFETGMY